MPKVKLQDHNLWLDGKQLTDYGTKENTFLNIGNGTSWNKNPKKPDLLWSPQTKYLVAFQTTNVPQRHVTTIELNHNQFADEMRA